MIGEIGYIFLIFAFTLSFLQFFNSVKISFFYFSEENFKFLKSLTYFISFFLLFSFFSLIISLNMFDGINGQSFINFLIISLYILTKGYFNEIICLLILLLLFFATLFKCGYTYLTFSFKLFIIN